MTNLELQNYLKQYPDDMPVKIIVDPELVKSKGNEGIFDLQEDSILHSSETAYVNEDAPEEEWDTEDGKIELGDGQQYLLFNPIIV